LVSATFHGRDIFAPVAGHLSLGIDPALLGPPAETFVRLTILATRPAINGCEGEVLFIDDFGNIITNIRAEAKLGPDLLILGGASFRRGEDFRRVSTYGEAEPGSLVVLVSSVGMFEVAVCQGNAAKRLGVKVGDAVSMGWAR
jgi:S-adenosylmethionine hydrolase